MAVEALRKNHMMAHLLGALERGEPIGRYGRLVFAMIAHHFLDRDELVDWLSRDPEGGVEEARSLAMQVERRGYSPPRRERILEWQRQQEFPIIPNADDPDEGNVYKDLEFPEEVYQHINEYYEHKAAS
ncbi:hypothetical protein BE04_07625 [Sorangium cellulosum]|uniref:Uncharacterized protein n=2 Tax=Sorangium cellulosum TaxID=56 RepID=A0A150PIW1_SORCE|nr:hypothetical protein [Sorangium cellulosum]AGP39687.1 hypothetical protein SCE1572_37465 [Sorangium cellulosum So0157-2]KYF55637.1 hypothetical protein BE04_07625 [Sorangium cellulosum]